MIKSIDSNQISYALSNQILLSGTSIGANIHESHYAQSKADFISKLEIALKECYETEYWLKVLNKSGKLFDTDYNKFIALAQEIRRMLIKSCTTAKSDNK